MEEQFNQEQNLADFENPQPKRKFGLSFACVLSFINAVWWFFEGIITFSAFNMLKMLYEDEDYSKLLEKKLGNENFEAVLATLSVNRYYYLISALLYAGSFVGVYYMWKLQKKGFHIYAIAQILILIVDVLMVTRVTGASPWFGAVTTAMFIAIYYPYYKKDMQ